MSGDLMETDMSDVNMAKSMAKSRSNYVFAVISIFWTVLLVGLFWFYYENEKQTAASSARLVTIHLLRKDLVYREWAGVHGGVYVPISEKTHPNQHLSSVPNRDIETSSGEKLTLVNPDYMIRQVNELGIEKHDLHGHLTSLNPVRPENAPDNWERNALQALQEGASEFYGLDVMAGTPFFRRIVPLKAEPACLKCHSDQGFKVGDLIGGMVVSLPWVDFHASLITETRMVAGMYGIVWLIGLMGCFVSKRFIDSQLDAQRDALDSLAKSESMLNTVLSTVPIGIGLVKDRIVRWTNDTLHEMSGYTRSELCEHDMRKFYESQQEFERVGAVIYPEISQTGRSRIEARLIRKDGRLADALMCLAAIDKSDFSAGAIFAVVDITDSKEMASRLKENVSRMERAEMAAKFGNWEFVPENDTVHLSAGAARIEGTLRRQIPLTELLQCVFPEYVPMLNQAWEDLIQNNKPYNVEFKFVRPNDGQEVYVNSVAGIDSDSGLIWGVIKDITAQKLAEEALAKSELLYRTLFECARDGIIIIDLEGEATGRIISANPVAAKMHGYSLDEFTSLSLADLETRESAYDLQDRVDAVLSGKYLRGEVNHRRKDGSEFPIEISANLIEILGHKYCIGIDRDISDRKLSEEALRASEKRFRSYVESSPIGILETDRSGIILSANTAYADLIGYSADDVPGTNMVDRIVPIQLSHYVQAFESLEHTGPVSLELEVTTFAGEPIWVVFTGIKLSNERYLLFSQNITDRKKAEDELKKASQETLLLMKSMTNGFVVYESVFDETGQFVDCRYVYVNDSFERLAGLAASEVIGKTAHELWPDLEEGWMENFRQVVLSGEPKTFEMYHGPTGKLHYCHVYRPWESTERFCLIFEDISEKKRAQEEILEMEKKLLQSQKLESLGVLTGGIAHDFNNLLAVIIGNIELAQDADSTSAEKELFLDRAKSASMKSASLVRQMLAYSGKGAFELSHVNLSEQIDKHIDMFRMAVSKNIDLKVTSCDDDIFVKADASQIQQVIMNLLINASEALEGKNGTIEITTGAQYCDRTIISKSLLPEKPDPQDMAFIIVRDDGIGMDAATVSRIFDPFFSTKFLGRGLGMSVVHGVVRGHHGALTIDSEPGLGTTITVYLPLLRRSERSKTVCSRVQTSSLSADEESFVSRNLRVLVVDDEQPLLDLAQRQLEHLGCQTFRAVNGREALEIFIRNPKIDLVILDLVMPEMGGVETFSRLKELKPDLEIVLCSGYNEEKFIDEFKSHIKPTAFVNKPYTFAILKDLIARLKKEHSEER